MKTRDTDSSRPSRATIPIWAGSARNSPEDLSGAVKAPLPEKLAPQLGTLSRKVPTSCEWIYEIKFDGYRILTRIDGGRARLFTRNGHDWTARMKPLARDLEAFGMQSGWLDGEVVVMNADGVPDFNALQNAFDASRTEPILYFLFDVPFFEGSDLRRVPLRARRALLKRLVEAKGTQRVRYSDDFPGDAHEHPGGCVRDEAGGPNVGTRLTSRRERTLLGTAGIRSDRLSRPLRLQG